MLASWNVLGVWLVRRIVRPTPCSLLALGGDVGDDMLERE